MTVSDTLKKQLPPSVHGRLQQAGRLTEKLQVRAYVVGGFVRDLLLHRPNMDLDLVVEGDGIAFARAFAKMVGADVVTHPRFGTAVVSFPDGFKLDVATARTEQYEQPGALPIVKPSSIEKDLYRRDFTINALAIRLDGSSFGELLDLYRGQRDLQRGEIRVLHARSFVDDPTRVFRAVRFEQRYGFRLGKETLALLKRAVRRKVFHRLSPSRLREEIILLLSEDDPHRVIDRLSELDLLQFIHPRLRRLRTSAELKGLLKGVAEALDWHNESLLSRRLETATLSERLPQLWLPYFAVLMDMIPPAAVRATLKRFGFPKRQADMIRTARLRANRILQWLGCKVGLRPSQTSRVLAGLPDEVLLYLLAKAPRKEIKQQIVAYLTEYRDVRPLLSGTGLKALGLKPGPQFKRLLDRLLAARLDGEVKTEADERDLVQKIVGEKSKKKIG
jgi:tRNA nucleotidyltransferase (CCA-adding enzyme)